MIGYATLGTNDLTNGATFYDQVLGQPASVGNGTMVALAVDFIERVRAGYYRALELGAVVEGEPGFRGGPLDPMPAIFAI